MIAHVTINVSDFAKSKEFYLKALQPLGYELVMEFLDDGVAGFGIDQKPDFWIHAGGHKQPVHVAFNAKDKEMVQAFYKAVMMVGGKDNGEPDYQLEYHAGYYGAFVFDPDGNNIEAVFHDPSKY